MATATKQIEALTAQGEKDTQEIIAIKQQLADSSMNADQRIGVLEGQCKAYVADLASLEASSSQSLSDLQQQLTKNKDELKALKGDHNELQMQLTSLQLQSKKTNDELIEMKAAHTAAKASADKTIADLHAQIKRNNDEMGVKNTELVALTKKFNDSVAAAAATKLTHEKDMLMVSNKVASHMPSNTRYHLFLPITSNN